jgi:hypothetical protein
MSAVKHTPGPWFFRADPRTGDHGIVADGTGVFAEAFADIRRAGEGNREEACANARLIAAAPDMLELHEKLLAWVEHWLADVNGGLKPTLNSLEKAEQAIREVIAKAEGQP